jgi:peptidoglycan-associated lipoprotein
MNWLALGLMVSALFVGGCKSRQPGADDFAAGGIDGIRGSDVYDMPMGNERLLTGSAVGSAYAPVYFEYDSSRIAPGERGKLEQVADEMKRRRGLTLIVEGHCDERGSREYNMALGERRALAVRAYLIGLGIDAARIQTKSFGEEKPAVMGHDEAAWSRNRRAELALYE